MSITDQLRQYATGLGRVWRRRLRGSPAQGQLELARTWTQAALLERQSYQSPPALVDALRTYYEVTGASGVRFKTPPQ
jgi:hypothetical protein